MEGDGHDSVSEVEGFLYPITVVNVYVNVQHSRVVPEGQGESTGIYCIVAGDL